jgi:hypothetical protein
VIDMAREIIMFTFEGMSQEALKIAKVELEKVFKGFDIIITNQKINTISKEHLQEFFDGLKEAGLVK